MSSSRSQSKVRERPGLPTLGLERSLLASTSFYFALKGCSALIGLCATSSTAQRNSKDLFTLNLYKSSDKLDMWKEPYIHSRERVEGFVCSWPFRSVTA